MNPFSVQKIITGVKSYLTSDYIEQSLGLR